MSVITKAAQVIDALIASDTPTKLGTLAQEVQLPKSSTHRLLADLVELGLARRLEDGEYRPGYRLVQWGHAADRAIGLRAAAEPLMRDLSSTVQESVYLHVLDGAHRVCVAAVDGPHTLRPHILVGQRFSLGVGAAGKVLLAHAEQAVRDEAWASADASARSCWPDAAALARIREQGWASTVAELESGLTAVATAVTSRTGEAVAALSVAGATGRLSAERCEQLLPELRATAREICRAVAA